MNILVINGSPKGKNSITLQTSLYLSKKYPHHTFNVLDAGQKIRSVEKDMLSENSKTLEFIRKADLIVFSYPVYTFLAPSQLHKFIEVLKSTGEDLSGKFVTQITTSKHFYDITAHSYIEENCVDMGMKYIRGLSADMDDLLNEKGREDAEKFFRYVRFCMKNDMYENKNKTAVKSGAASLFKATVPEEALKFKDGDVVIVADLPEGDSELRTMIDRFRSSLPLRSRVINIREYPFSGGCLGCFNCAVSGKCIYKDGFDEFLRTNIQKSQAFVYAFEIKDHSMGSLFKMFDDRQFCNGHRTVTKGTPVGYIVSGHLSEEENLRTVMKARSQVGGNFLCGIATNEKDPDMAIDDLAKTVCYAVNHKHTEPANFYGVGGMKIFRDLIYLMQGMMKADHKFYKKNGEYDFPQKQKGTLIKMYLVGALLSSPKIKEKMGNKMTEGMIAPYKKVIDGVDK
ncbi:MAG: iron-sulfur protein [Ruminococcaceae bacterium]|nr:iron-sulfur protein [Oscillospiraceae bacterium]